MAIRRGASRGAPVAPARKKRARLPLKQILHLAHRTCIFLSALVYIKLSLDSAVAAVGLLRGRDDPLLPSDVSTFDLMGEYVGTATLRESRLVKNALQDRTAPVNGTLYLHSSAEPSFARCPSIPEAQQEIYENRFQRSIFEAVVRDASYHITEIAETAMELIAPVVDCTTTDILDGDASSSRFFFLTRQLSDANNVSMVIISLSNQPYANVAQGEEGPAGVATVQIVHDMRARAVATHYVVSIGYPFEYFDFRAYEYINTTSSGFWTLQSVPRDDSEMLRHITTANRDGFYIKAESEQSNINVEVWEPDTTDPFASVTKWRWTTKPVITDSWAWVHVIQFYIGARLLANLVILCIATLRNVRAGKWWVGDAFVAISTAQLANGALVLLSWFMNEYWVLHEFAFFIAYEVSGATQIFIDTAPVQAGMLTMYFSLCGIIGYILREKIDPFFVMICYGLGFELRIGILKAIPSLRAEISEYANYSYMRGVSESVEGQVEISPMRMWTTHPIGTRNYGFVFQCLFPIYGTLVFVVLYAVVRKIYRHFHPEVLHGQHTTTATGRSGREDAVLSQKRVLTLFEVATGAELENRFGMVSDYETCLFIKGMKFASADGIYSTGFVIANKKYLLQTHDYWSIVLMKIIRRRYTNIFVYEVDGNTVQQMARLVYPQTLTFHDLANVNVSVLS